MRVDDLRQQLASAADLEPAADVGAARGAVTARARRAQNQRLAAIGACVAVLLVAATLSAVRIGRAPDDADLGTTGNELPRLVPSFVPPGLTMELIDLPGNDLAVFPEMRQWIYARGEMGSPNAGGESFAVIVVTPTDEMRASSPAQCDSGSSKSGFVNPSSPCPAVDGPDGLRIGAAQKEDGAIVLVASRTLPDDELLRIASTVRLKPGGADIEPVAMPGTYRLVAANVRAPYLEGQSLAVSMRAQGYVEVWSDDHARTRACVGECPPRTSIALGATRGTQADLDALQWWLPDATPRSIRGHPGVVGSVGTGSTATSKFESVSASVPTTVPTGASAVTTGVPAAPSTTTGTLAIRENPRVPIVAWIEGGALVSIQGQGPGIDVDTLLRVAEGLRVVDDDGWRRFLSSTTTTTMDPSCTTTPDGGRSCKFASVGSAVGAPIDEPTTTLDPANTFPGATAPSCTITADGQKRCAATAQGTAIAPASAASTTSTRATPP